MSRCRGLLSHLSKRQPRYHRWLSNGIAHTNNSAGVASDSTVAPSQVLRYALSGDLETHTTSRKTTQLKINDKLELILSKRKLGKEHKYGSLISLPGSARVPTELRNVSDLQELKLWFEQFIVAGFWPSSELKVSLKDALLRCEKLSSSLEILSVLTTVISRLKDAEIPIHEPIRVAGLHYAFQSFSAPAIRHHLATSKTPLDPKTTDELTQCLLQTLRTVRLADPAYDTGPMLELVAERTSSISSPEPTFLNLARFGEGSNSPFIELLCELGVKKAHKQLWNNLMEYISNIKRSPEGVTSEPTRTYQRQRHIRLSIQGCRFDRCSQ
uniref:Uncharacterized protein n=1 Tax=Talaromyces marneffei PM1 TaxID=1077442 RepID=A0A093V3G3_TALMA